MKIIIGRIVILTGCVIALIFGWGIGTGIYGGDILGRLIGLGIGFLMILGLCYIGENLEIF